MPESGAPHRTVTINRAPVLTLWAAVVAERLGYDRDEALTLGQAVAGMNAAAKARAIGKSEPSHKPKAATKPKTAKELDVGERVEILLCNRMVPALRTPEGLRALNKGAPASPASVRRYLESKFGDALKDAREAMVALARSLPKGELETAAFGLYETFRPSIPRGTRGWGAKGILDLARLRALAEPGRATP